MSLDEVSIDRSELRTVATNIKLRRFNIHLYQTYICTGGRAIAQAVSRRLPTAAALFEPRSDRVAFVVNKVALEQVFSEYFGLSCQFLFHRVLHTRACTVRGWYNRPVSGRRTKWTQSHLTKKKNYRNNYICTENTYIMATSIPADKHLYVNIFTN
jgi:hypothetical protein